MMKRVTDISELQQGDEVVWCEQLIIDRRYYDAWTGDIYSDTPVKEHRGVV